MNPPTPGTHEQAPVMAMAGLRRVAPLGEIHHLPYRCAVALEQRTQGGGRRSSARGRILPQPQ